MIIDTDLLKLIIRRYKKFEIFEGGKDVSIFL